MGHAVFGLSGKEGREAGKLLDQAFSFFDIAVFKGIALVLGFYAMKIGTGLNDAVIVFKGGNALEGVNDLPAAGDEDDVGIFAHQFDI